MYIERLIFILNLRKAGFKIFIVNVIGQYYLFFETQF